MDWIKVKSEHISPLYTNAHIGALVRYQLLVAQIGRIPQKKEITKIINSNCIKSLQQTMSTLGVSLEYIASKVLEDREYVERKKNISKATSQRYRKINKTGDTSRDNDGDVTDKSREDKSREDKSRVFKKPTIEEIKKYCEERNNSVDSDKFFNYYETSNWFRGKNKIKDWKACVRTWEAKEKKQETKYNFYLIDEESEAIDVQHT